MVGGEPGQTGFSGAEPGGWDSQSEPEQKNGQAEQFGRDILSTLGLSVVKTPKVQADRLVLVGGITEEYNMHTQKTVVLNSLLKIDGIETAELQDGERPPFKIIATTDGKSGITAVEIDLVRDLGPDLLPRRNF